ncbi:MAG: ABC transporter ATP-binding protein, partial [bacterium]|nr:ABC transporter ATP-binding protein [bacterium]
MTEAALAIRGLEKRFPKFALGPLDLTVPRGGIYGFIGPNGAGKTTTIDLVMHMGRGNAGTIEVFGMDHIKQEAEVKARTGYVSPDLDFTAWGKVGRLLSFLRGFFPDWDDTYCDQLLTRFKMSTSDRISTLSFGNKTKLSLVAALAHRPSLLLLDEPQAGLDAVAKRDLFTELLDAVQDEDRTVLISSHNLDEIERFADHIGIIDNGHMIEEGATSDLLERYRVLDAPGPANGLGSVDGVRCLDGPNDRVRALVDVRACPAERLTAAGLAASDM